MISDEDLTEIRESFRKAMTGPPRFVRPLPRKVRLRLWLAGRVDEAAYWLVCHDHCDAARRLWQLFRMW